MNLPSFPRNTLLLLGASLSACSLFSACQRQESSYDPQLDGISPQRAVVTADASGNPYILQDPKSRKLPSGPSLIPPPAASPARLPTSSPAPALSTAPAAATAPVVEPASAPAAPTQPG